LIPTASQAASSGARSLQPALAKAQQVLKDAEPKRKETQKTLKEKQALLAKTHKMSEDGKAELQALADKEASLRECVKKMRGQLEDSKSAQQASKSTSNVLRVLTDAKKSGKVVGIHGRLGDLGTIEDKFDVAITTACGGLNNIVWRTLRWRSTAATCCARRVLAWPPSSCSTSSSTSSRR